MLENLYPFPCSECDKAFKRNDHLKRHCEAVHSQIKYMCNICGKKMSRKDHLKRHGNVHPSVPYPSSPNNENFVDGDVGLQHKTKNARGSNRAKDVTMTNCGPPQQPVVGFDGTTYHPQ